MSYLLDTNLISEVMRREPHRAVLEWLQGLDGFATSVICLEELVFGLRRRRLYHQEAWLRRFLADRAVVFPVSDAAAHWCGEKRAQLEAQGRVVAQSDGLIAACAWEQGLVLATRNTRDFEGFGIALINPFEAA